VRRSKFIENSYLGLHPADCRTIVSMVARVTMAPRQGDSAQVSSHTLPSDRLQRGADRRPYVDTGKGCNEAAGDLTATLHYQ
jgi:hypothetical protein